ncbi:MULTISPECIES: alpha/beta hydrolase family protein [Rhodococcus]|uniref:alpha/beta hydrolase family protein n=1 Tax=Rhodococcus TaxID=1827 RepID=UPI001E2F57B4|nr:alpha/beta fold hydrolase [Rhodococcus pyridinivorans]MCD2116262.1 alpha/beta fold hydrolase [Rhodococcus pyridinivorans]MCZ4625130.1 alpha/beta fold hydrolase [Rhodococcus pyridinivorans]MCZ4646351.1 alpha/beta fold hydrolase [Rhodococcus pyridinivorans]MDJ0484539.1 alpha/beta fold hydrolase [Rhodococcus pyridinivorans]MDV7252443.1 alpha/beta fold hydrolase [Rhodococcus pyridinivorans]
METVPIQLPGGTTAPVRLFAGPDHEHETRRDASRAVVVIVPGLGIPAGYYEPFAQAITEHGFDAAICELAGQGDSRPRPGPDSTYGYHEIVATHFPAVFEVVRERFPDSTPYLLGHSMGGQLGVLYAARIRGRLGGLILVTSGTPYYRQHVGIRGPGLWLGSTAMSLTAAVAGFWPGDRIDVAGFGRQSRVLISDWARLARTGRFEPAGANIDYEERVGRLTLPVLSITIEDDDLTPVASAQHLLEKLPSADVARWHNPRALGHNGWIRDNNDTVAKIVAWLRDR